jgi:hypothetical protein
MSEAELHAAIVRAHAAGNVTIDLDPAYLRRSHTPGFRPTDIVVPPFVILGLSAYLLVYNGPIAGGAGLLAGVVFWWLVIRPRNRRRAEEHVRGSALASPEDWMALWGKGIVALRKGDRACIAPECDWRDFARAHLTGAT